MSIRPLNSILDAVNLCLAGIGMAPVPSLDSHDLDAEQARAAIEQAAMNILSNSGNGWWFNVEGNWNLTPDPYNGFIKIPNGVLGIRQAVIGRTEYTRRLAIRGGKIYDKVNHSHDLRDVCGGCPLTFTFIMHLDFEDLPASARQAVAWAGRSMFCMDIEGDERKLQYNNGVAGNTLRSLNSEHITQMKYNAAESPALREFTCGVDSFTEWNRRLG